MLNPLLLIWFQPKIWCKNNQKPDFNRTSNSFWAVSTGKSDKNNSKKLDFNGKSIPFGLDSLLKIEQKQHQHSDLNGNPPRFDQFFEKSLMSMVKTGKSAPFDLVFF